MKKTDNQIKNLPVKSQNTSQPSSTKSSSNVWLVILLMLLIFTAIGGGFWLWTELEKNTLKNQYLEKELRLQIENAQKEIASVEQEMNKAIVSFQPEIFATKLEQQEQVVQRLQDTLITTTNTLQAQIQKLDKAIGDNQLQILHDTLVSQYIYAAQSLVNNEGFMRQALTYLQQAKNILQLKTHSQYNELLAKVQQDIVTLENSINSGQSDVPFKIHHVISRLSQMVFTDFFMKQQEAETDTTTDTAEQPWWQSFLYATQSQLDNILTIRQVDISPIVEKTTFAQLRMVLIANLQSALNAFEAKDTLLFRQEITTVMSLIQKHLSSYTQSAQILQLLDDLLEVEIARTNSIQLQSFQNQAQ